MPKIAVVYHSGFGHTEKMAQSVAAGAKKIAAQVVLMNVDEAQKNWTELHTADAIIFGAPTYLGSVSAPMKAFMDASGEVWTKQIWKDKIAAGFTNSGSPSGDKLSSLVQISLFAAQHGMIWVGLGVMPHADEDGNHKKGDINRLGSFLGAMAQSGDDPPGITPPKEDLRTAELLGERVAKYAQRLKISA